MPETACALPALAMQLALPRLIVVVVFVTSPLLLQKAYILTVTRPHQITLVGTAFVLSAANVPGSRGRSDIALVG